MLGSPSLGAFHGFGTRFENDRSAGKDPSALGLALLELLEDLALLLIFRGPFGGPQAGGVVAVLVGGELLAGLGVGLVPLALLYVAPAVYSHAFSFLIDSPDERARNVRAFAGRDALLSSYPA